MCGLRNVIPRFNASKNMTLKYNRVGRSNGNADALSRRHCDEIDCTFCLRLEKKEEKVVQMARREVANEEMSTDLTEPEESFFRFGAWKNSSNNKRKILICYS